MRWSELKRRKEKERDLGLIIFMSVPVSAQHSDEQVLAAVNTH